jgi:Protein of unknown function (DUF541)
MRIAIAAVSVASVALIAAGTLGVAGAETTTAPVATVVPRTVSVQGVASAPVEPTASTAAATAVYRQAMAAAIADGQSKAQFLAEKTGATLGAVQSISEGNGYIQCPGEEEYQGGQPDFGSGSPVVAVPVAFAKGHLSPSVHKAPVKHHKRRASAKKAAVEPCALSTQVALSYQLS